MVSENSRTFANRIKTYFGMSKKNLSFIIAFIACTILCGCGNSSKNNAQLESPENPKKVLNDFIDDTETKPETV